MLQNKKYSVQTFVLAAYFAIQIVFLIARLKHKTQNIADICFLSAILLVIFFARKSLKIKDFTFILLAFSFVLHIIGTFGFYNKTPVFIEWDHITHFVGIGTFTLLIYDYFKRVIVRLRKDTKKSDVFFYLLFILLAANGVGAMIEIGEYAGYSIFGQGQGGFRFGLGDVDKIVVTEEVMTDIEINAGGWFDSMDDLIWNLFASVVVLIALYLTDCRQCKKI